MHTERLTKLAELLETYQGPLEFYMGTFHCGYAACACGLAAAGPWFNAQGFELSAPAVLQEGPVNLLPVFGGLHGLDAANAFFQVDRHIGAWLFFGSSYSAGVVCVTREMVAERVRRLLEISETKFLIEMQASFLVK